MDTTSNQTKDTRETSQGNHSNGKAERVKRELVRRNLKVTRGFSQKELASKQLPAKRSNDELM